MTSSEKEQKRLIELVDKGVGDVDRERHKLIKTQRESAQLYVVLQRANQCIDDCLDAGNITDTNLLQEVENIRTMIRELKTGELYSLTLESGSGGGGKKLRTRFKITILIYIMLLFIYSGKYVNILELISSTKKLQF